MVLLFLGMIEKKEGKGYFLKFIFFLNFKKKKKKICFSELLLMAMV